MKNRVVLLTVAFCTFAIAWFGLRYIDSQKPMPDGLLFPLGAATLACCFLGMKRIRRMRILEPLITAHSRPQKLLLALLSLLPLAGLPYITSKQAPDFEMRALPSGEPASSMTWHTRGDRFFVVLNRKLEQEITRAEYEEILWRFSGQFVLSLVLFSYIAVCLAWFAALWPDAKPAES